MSRSTLASLWKIIISRATLALFLPLGGIFFVFCLTYFSVNKFANSDPYLSLLVSQAILEDQTIQLDRYKDSAQPPLDQYGSGGMILRQNEHYYYYLPIGSSLVALPFVQVARLMGLDMQLPKDVFAVHRVLAALLSALIFGIIYKIAESYLEPISAFVIASVSVLGTTLTSTVGTALWNMGFVVLFTSLALLLIVRFENGKSRDIHPYWLGFFLFAAYLCRPTSAIFIALLLVYLLLKHRSAFLKTAASALFFLLLFVAHSWLEYGQWLPTYYGGVGGRLAAHGQRVPLLTALYGTTLSPSRGLFVFSPFFAWVLVMAVGRFKGVAKVPLVWLSLLWFALHLFVTTTTTRWWGGHSYGPRLLTDMLPALILITVLVWRDIRTSPWVGLRRGVVAGYLLLGLVGIFIHSVQGLYNNNTQMWNGGLFAPNVDIYQEYLFDWQYPQFLASADALCNREQSFYERQVAQFGDNYLPQPYALGTSVGFDYKGQDMLFTGWSFPEQGGRWSLCHLSQLVFRLGDEVRANQSYEITFAAGSYGAQEVTMVLNGTPVTTFAINSKTSAPLTTTVTIDGALLNANALNVIELRLPDAKTPIAALRSLKDQRLLGLSFVSFRLAEKP